MEATKPLPNLRPIILSEHIQLTSEQLRTNEELFSDSEIDSDKDEPQKIADLQKNMKSPVSSHCETSTDEALNLDDDQSIKDFQNLHQSETNQTISSIKVSADQTLLSIGTFEGEYHAYDVVSLKCTHSHTQFGMPIIHADTLDGLDLAIVVASKVPTRHIADASPIAFNVLYIWDFNSDKLISSLYFTSDGNQISSHLVLDREGIPSISDQLDPTKNSYVMILTTQMSFRRLVVFLDSPYAQIEVFELKTMQSIYRIERNVHRFIYSDWAVTSQGRMITNVSSSSLAAVSAFSINPSCGYLIVPVAVAAVQIENTNSVISHARFVSRAASHHKYHPDTGSIAVLDVYQQASLIQTKRLHKQPLVALACNRAGTMLITSSIKGTILRIWFLPTLETLWTWRRGSQSVATLALGFSANSRYLWTLSCKSNVDFSHLKERLISQMSSIDFQDGILPNIYTNKSLTIHVLSCCHILTLFQRKRNHNAQDSPALFEALIDANQDIQSTKDQDLVVVHNEDVYSNSNLQNQITNYTNYYPLFKNYLKVTKDKALYWQDIIASTTKKKMKKAMDTYLIPCLPSSVREIMIDSQSSFAICRLGKIPIKLHPALGVSLVEYPRSKQLEV